MLTGDQVVDLLTLAARYDRRTVGRQDVEAWHKAASIGRWTFQAAWNAIENHYALFSPRDRWLSPGDVTAAVHADSRQPARFDRAALPASVSRGLDGQRQVDRELALTVACTEPPPRGCGAVIGELCRNLSSGDPLTRLPAHDARLRAAGVSHAPVPSAEVRGDDVPRRRR